MYIYKIYFRELRYAQYFMFVEYFYTFPRQVRFNRSSPQALEDEEKMTPEQLAIKNVGKQDPKRHLEEKVDTLMATNIVQCLGAMLDTVVFK